MRSGPASLLLAFYLACSSCGGGGSAPAAEPSTEPSTSGTGAGEGASDEARQAESERKLRAAQESALEALCDRLVDCAIESARANMSPEEVAKLGVQELAPRLRDDCEADGGRSEWSPRQVRITQRCLTAGGTCDELNTCLDEARKKSP